MAVPFLERTRVLVPIRLQIYVCTINVGFCLRREGRIQALGLFLGRRKTLANRQVAIFGRLDSNMVSEILIQAQL